MKNFKKRKLLAEKRSTWAPRSAPQPTGTDTEKAAELARRQKAADDLYSAADTAQEKDEQRRGRKRLEGLKRGTRKRVLAQVAVSSGSKRAKKDLKDSTEYHRLGYVLAEALRVEDEEPRSSNAYVRALKESDRYHRPVGGWQPGAAKLSLKKKKEKLTTKEKVLAQVAAGSGSKKAAEDLK